MSEQKKLSAHAERVISTLPIQIANAMRNGKPFRLSVDGEVTELTLSKGVGEQLSQLQEAVGGYIAIVPCDMPHWKMYVNEEGSIRGLAINPHANALYGRRMFSAPLVGPAVLVPPGI